MNLILYKHQKELLELNPKRTGLWWEPGCGKTPVAVLLACKNCSSCLVICPKSVKNNWKREINKWKDSNTEFYITTKESFRDKESNTLPKYDGLIFDEAHAVANYKSKMYKSVKKYIIKYGIKNIWLLTGTPYLSTPFNLYSLGVLLGEDWSWIKFKQYFFDSVKMGKIWIPKPKPNMEKEIARLFNKIGFTKELSECVDMPEEDNEIEYFNLTSEQIKAVEEIDEVIPIVRASKELQIINGCQKSDGYSEDKFYESEKMDRIIEIIDSQKKLAIICKHKLEIESIKNKIQNRKVFIISGGDKEREKTIDEIDKTDNCVVIISAGVSEGYNMQSIKYVVFYSLSYSWKDMFQVRRRFKRIDKPQKVIYKTLLVRDSIDIAVHKNIIKKKNFVAEIYFKQKNGI